MTDPFAEIQRWGELIKAVPQMPAYLVLDPNRSPELPPDEGVDALGRLYQIASPAILDEMQHRKLGDRLQALALGVLTWVISIYRLEDMPAGWPEGWPE